MKLTYTLKEHGWAEIQAELGNARIQFPVSYMSHALNDLVIATIDVLTVQSVSRFALIDEPGSYCWILARKADLVQITVVHVDSMYAVERYNKSGNAPDAPAPEEDGRLVVSWELPAPEFGNAVTKMLDEIEANYKLEDFSRTRNKAVSPELSGQLRRLLHRNVGGRSGDQP